MDRRTALKVPLLLAAGSAMAGFSGSAPAAAAGARWTPERANSWYQGQGWLVGGNYITSTAVNQLEMFQSGTYDPGRIDAELGAARWFGFNTVRVFLHDLLWAQDPQGFSQRLSQFVGIASGHGIKPLFVFFDSCWDPHPRLGVQRAPTPGVHNWGWVQSPGADRLGDASYRAVLQNYVTGVLNLFRNDNRVLGWDLWNEPDNPASVYRKVERSDKIKLVTDLLPQVFALGPGRRPRATTDKWCSGKAVGPIPRSAAPSRRFSWTTRTSSRSTATPSPPTSRPASTSWLRSAGRSCAPSTWPGTRAAPSRASCQ
ncbi:hypothetical protein MAUB1S_02093 [Mycolicibacterium aubagnense]